MSKTKEAIMKTNEPIDVQYDEDYLYEQYLTQEKLNEEYWQMKEKETIEMLNATYESRFCFADVMAAVVEVTDNEKLAYDIGIKLNELYVRRITFESQISS